MSEMDKLSELKDEFINMMEEGWGRKGAESVKGRIIAVIYLSSNPITQEKIAKSIINRSTSKHYSRSQISRHLKDLVQAGIIARKTKPGTKIYEYEGREASTFDNFQLLLVERQQFLLEIVEIMDKLIEKWKTLPRTSKKSAEGIKFKDVVSNYSNMTHITLDIIKDYIKRYEAKMRELEEYVVDKEDSNTS
ncbi:MAG: hypothetical protein ACXAEU_15120 [Candidatus Hodarchaeales archaeon]|jgi:DNA-binding transcriptional regulator GbsR (MarR family)